MFTLGLAAARCGVREVGLSDRCADLMQEAFPGGDVEITSAKAHPDKTAATVTVIIAEVEGVRSAVAPGGMLAHDLAVECRFENGILTGFRWTKGPLFSEERH